MSRLICACIILALAAGCRRDANPEQERQAAGRALRGTLAYPRSTMVTVSAGTEAAELTMTSPDSLATIATWFRRVLPLNGWNVQRVTSGRAGEMTILAERREGPPGSAARPLWITLRPSVGGTGTTYTMIGAIPADSTKH
jgi:hypothetical protein